MSPNRFDYTALRFESDVKSLGPTGFSNWLSDSFLKSEPLPKAGWFRYDEDDHFGFAFGNAAQRFKPEVLDICRKGLDAAIKDFDPRTNGFEALFHLVAIAEALTLGSVFSKLSEALNFWLPTSGEPEKSPNSVRDLFFLRESLECAFRAIWDADSATKKPEPFLQEGMVPAVDGVGKWCLNWLIKRSDDRVLVPAWAPMYVLSLKHLIHTADPGLPGRDPQIDLLQAVLHTGRLLPRDSNDFEQGGISKEIAEFFFIYDEPMGRYPYALTRLLQATEFLRKFDADRWIARPLPDGDPFARSSATEGLTPVSQEDPYLALDVICEDDDPTMLEAAE